MPSIQVSHDRRFALANVAILNAARYSEHRQSASPIFKGATAFKALIDTGATTTLISDRVVARVGLDQVGKKEYTYADGTVWLDAYLFQVGFYEREPPPDGQAGKIRVFRDVIHGGKFAGHSMFDVLLGMDILSKGDFTLSRNGTYSFSF